MRKVLKLTLAVALVLSSTTLFAQKFGRINSSELIALMPETKEFQTNMEALGKELNDNIEAISVEFNNKYQEFQKNVNTYTESVREIKAKELNDLQARREQLQQMASDEYQKRYNELFAPIAEKAKSAIDKVAKANGYLVVFDTTQPSMAYFDEAALTNLLPDVKKELGIADAPAAETAAK